MHYIVICLVLYKLIQSEYENWLRMIIKRPGFSFFFHHIIIEIYKSLLFELNDESPYSLRLQSEYFGSKNNNSEYCFSFILKVFDYLSYLLYPSGIVTIKFLIHLYFHLYYV